MPLPLYAAALLPGLFALAALLVGGAALWATPLFVFGLVPLAELLLPAHAGPADPGAPSPARRRIADALIALTLPLQAAVVLAFLAGATSGAWSAAEWAGALASTALGCGGYGINVAHELGHRPERGWRLAARLLLVTSFYDHFYVEHNRGHHARVATDADPASSRQGESLYAFWVRSMVGGYRSAFAIEAARLHGKARHPVLSLQNTVFVGQLIQAALFTAAALTFGLLPALGWLLAGLGGGLLLETINYIEHYGLRRAIGPDGRPERVRPAHSWNADHPFGRLLLFELTRHSDHHAHPARPYAALRHFEAAPQLPTGYPGMMLLAAVPPLFFRVMDARLAAEQARLARAAAA